MRHRDIVRPKTDLIPRIAPLATSTLANALDESGLPANVIAGIEAVVPGFRLAGPAVSVKESSGGYGPFSSRDFNVGAMIDAAAAKLKGVAGLVVDGGVRDLEEIAAFEFPVFARHLVPTTGRMRLKVEAINVPVGIGGVAVAPGDIVVADGTGIVCLPRQRAEAVVDLAEQFARDDAAARQDLKDGLTFSEAMARYRKI